MKETLSLYAKGLAMGLADLVPGVSGGTIALLTGIYPRLIRALAHLDVKFLWAFFLLRKWKDYDVLFLVTLAAGALTGILAGAQVIHYLLLNYSPPLFAFFAGLICATLPITGLHVLRARRVLFVCGLLIGLAVSFTSGIFLAFQPVYIFLAGLLAACAMLLPGISGSFVLVLLGIYAPLIGAVAALDWIIMAIFALGAALGILFFSRVLDIFLQKHKERTLALMLGLMGGVLPRLWPWQAREENFVLLWPDYYEVAIQQPAYVLASLATFIVGVGVLVILHRLHPW